MSLTDRACRATAHSALAPLALALLTHATPAMATAYPRMEGGLTAVYQHETETGLSDAGASVDFFAYLPTRRGEWMLHLEAATAKGSGSLFDLLPEINADAGTAQDAQGDARLQISELNYRWNLGTQQNLTLGTIDVAAHLDRSRIANDENTHFLAPSFVNNPTIEFPDYTLGAMYRRSPGESMPEITAIVSGSNGLADNPRRSYGELVDLTDSGKGIFAGLGARWYTRTSTVGVGAWYRSDDHVQLNGADDDRHNYGAYAVYEWHSGVHGVTLRAGAARPSVSRASRYLGAAYERLAPLGALGIGFGHTFLSDRDRQADRADTTQVELFYRLALGSENIHVTPALQYLKNSGFDSAGSILDAEVLVAAVRFHVFLRN
ncbi:MAG TPA: hypothetical protein VIS76_11635 [Pseudomonadales bacterium]